MMLLTQALIGLAIFLGMIGVLVIIDLIGKLLKTILKGNDDILGYFVGEAYPFVIGVLVVLSIICALTVCILIGRCVYPGTG
jgi:hypothetical protein